MSTCLDRWNGGLVPRHKLAPPISLDGTEWNTAMAPRANGMCTSGVSVSQSSRPMPMKSKLWSSNCLAWGGCLIQLKQKKHLSVQVRRLARSHGETAETRLPTLQLSPSPCSQVATGPSRCHSGWRTWGCHPHRSGCSSCTWGLRKEAWLFGESNS